ncbi:NAD-dependent epimerase/dehydratase family protein [Synechocystis sp. CACIAM 05]|uniref:NAD-dependent epimerase/dehydratase family protein n=1 Tax=Synechocystis sp. CACIAM 05 TaxID=1933929 RepID=UPI00138E727A|nr:NAD(P)-dependent oxidoreductase [Synechocystis sp. CACIAM 05]QHV00850.1 epimerase [Synechocystis sp. CACIAM 05]
MGMASLKRIFITGISGCIGHYLADELIQGTDHELFLLVRNPGKLQFDPQLRSNIHLIPGDMGTIEAHADLLQTMDCAILIATSWGDRQETYNINVVKTLTLINLLNPERCEQVIYFSTASILDRQGQPLPEAGSLGTDYIRTKYLCHQALESHHGSLPEVTPIAEAMAKKITVVYPTLVFGGEPGKPYSHLSGGLGEILRWLPLIRWFRADGSFHFIHGRDIARVVAHYVDHPPGKRIDVVLGNAPLTATDGIRQVCQYHRQKIYFQIPLSLTLANIFIKLFRIQMADWDRFCLDYRHFTYPDPVAPAQLGLPAHCQTIAELMAVSPKPHARN